MVIVPALGPDWVRGQSLRKGELEKISLNLGIPHVAWATAWHVSKNGILSPSEDTVSNGIVMNAPSHQRSVVVDGEWTNSGPEAKLGSPLRLPKLLNLPCLIAWTTKGLQRNLPCSFSSFIYISFPAASMVKGSKEHICRSLKSLNLSMSQSVSWRQHPMCHFHISKIYL